MATVRKRGDKWQVQIRRKGHTPHSRSFLARKDAEAWARQAEVQADRGCLSSNLRILDQLTVRDLVERYRDTVTPLKRCHDCERTFLETILGHPISRKSLAQITRADFARYRDDRLKVVSAVSVKRELSPVQNMFEIAMREWSIPLDDNPLKGLRIPTVHAKRERRLRGDEWVQLMESVTSHGVV